jgi:acetyltransferase-like isoleucine patch superfamily enzyme
MHRLLRHCRRWFRRRREERTVARYRVAHLGAHTHLDPSVQILGWQQIRIGNHTVISADTWLNVNERGIDAPIITIGNNCFIGRRNFLSAGAFIKIGDYCLTGVDCHFLGSDHIHSSPFVPYSTSGVTSDGIIEIGPNCWLGSSVTVLKNVKIGYGSIVGAAAVVTRDVPPLSIVVGNPARVIRRFDTRQDAWVELSSYPVDGDQHLPGEAEYVSGLRRSHPAIKAPLIASSPRFGDI